MVMPVVGDHDDVGPELYRYHVCAAAERIVARRTADRIIAVAACQAVVACSAADDVRTKRGRQRFAAGGVAGDVNWSGHCLLVSVDDEMQVGRSMIVDKVY